MERRPARRAARHRSVRAVDDASARSIPCPAGSVARRWACCAAGFTLVELLVAVALLAIATGAAAPTFRSLAARVARAERLQSLEDSLRLARLEALARGSSVVVCASGDGVGCSGAVDWSGGWIAFVDAEPPRGRRSAGEPLLAVVPARAGASVAANRAAIEFAPDAAFATTASLVVCVARGGLAAQAPPQALIVSRTGRVRRSDRDAAGQPLACG